MNRSKLVIIAGPTASGKTDISLRLAEEINGEIISADSMQVYRGMDIGTAKISPSEMRGIRHHLIDVADPADEFNAAKYKELADRCIADVTERGKIPIVAGGTGFYINALFRDTGFARYDEDPETDGYLENVLNEQGSHGLHELLRDIDPVSYKNIHENNVKRIMRALKFYHLTGTPISEHNEAEKKKESPYNSAYFVLTKERSMLYRDIDRRVDIMLGKGLVDEVKGLAEAGCTPGMVSMQAIGYKEVFSYLDGSSTLEETTELIKKNTRHYAKRQLTWFRAVDDAIWIYKDRFESDDEIIAYMKKELEDRGII